MVFFGLCGAGWTWYAVKSGPPAGLLGFYVDGAPSLGLAVLGFAPFVAALALLIRSRRLGPRELIIAPSFIEIPRNPWSRSTVRIERAHIKRFIESDIVGNRIITITTDEGKRPLNNRLLGDDGYEALKEWLAGR
jgi:hypothetical protein